MFVAMATTRRIENSQDCGFGNRFYLGVINVNDAMADKLWQPAISYLIVEGCDLVGQHAVLVHQKTEAPLLLQQSLPAAICEEQLHVHLTARQCFQALATNTEGALRHQNSKSAKMTPAPGRKQSTTLVDRSIISGK